MTAPLITKTKIHFRLVGKGSRRSLREGEDPRGRNPEDGHVPRVSRLMALAIRFEELIREGHVENYSHLALLGHVSKARITQIMNLLILAPDVQEEILFLARTVEGRDRVILAQLQPIAAALIWSEQRRLWKKLLETTEG